MTAPRRRRTASRLAQSLVCVALLLSGCRLDLDASARVEADGSGAAEVVINLDRELLETLDAAGVDPTAELEAAVAETPRWTVQRVPTEDGGLRVRLHHEVDDAAALGDVYRDLSEGLDAVDPALVVDIDVVVDQRGAVNVRGTAAARPPRVPAATRDGEPVGPDADELAQLADEALDAQLLITLPGAIERHDGDERDGNRVRFALSDTPRNVEVVAAPPAWWESLPVGLVVALGAGLFLVGIGAVAFVVRRRA